MSRAFRDVTVCREALALSELRQQWRAFYKSDASPHLSREFLMRAIAYRLQEVALGGLRPERQRQLRQIAQQFNETGEIRRRARLELKSGTRLVREWRGRTYEVLVLDGGFSWQGRSTVRFPRSRERSSMNLELTDEQTEEALVRKLRNIVQNDRYPSVPASWP